uniref:Uncharacterized protein n=1 Tax=Tetradesmus obliquus TaxID=3088 RepID=A0A383VGA5_TETOB
MMVRQQDQHQCFTEVHGLVDAASKPQQQQSNSGQEQLMHMRSTAVSALPSRVRNWAGTWQQPCGNSSNNGSG